MFFFQGLEPFVCLCSTLPCRQYRLRFTTRPTRTPTPTSFSDYSHTGLSAMAREFDERIVRELDERTLYDSNSNRKERTATGLKSCDSCRHRNLSPLAAINPFDEVVETRICSLPTKAATDIYDKLGYRHYPFRKMKICSTQT